MDTIGVEGRTDLTSDKWQPWIEDVCTRLGVDPVLVDVPLVHDLTRHIAHRYDRPMAPVGSYIMGIALGAALAGGQTDAAALLSQYEEQILQTLPPETSPAE